jgi:hypothetical protein
MSEVLLRALFGWAQALPANIRLGRKSLTVTNTQAYYYTVSITYVESFILRESIVIVCSKHF